MNKPYENQMPSGVDSFVKEASKEEVKTPEKPMQQKFTSKDYGNVRVYPNETGSNMDKNNKWIGKRYSLMEAHNLNDDYLKNNLVGKTKSGADIYKMPDGYFSGNPRINDASFKNIQDLEDFEKKSGEHRAAMKEGTYLDDFIKNYNQPKQSPEQKLMDVKSVRDAVIDDTLKDTKVNKDIVKKAADAEFNQEQPEVDDLSDDELKEELVDNKYYYENARNEEEVAKWLAERQDIPYDRALAFVKANYKGGAIWNDKYEKKTDLKSNEEIDWDLAEKTEKINGSKGKSETRKDKYGNPLLSDEAFKVGVEAGKAYLEEALKYDSLESLKKSNVFLGYMEDYINNAIVNNGYNPNLDSTYQDINEIIGVITGEEVDMERYQSDATKGFTGKKYSGYNPLTLDSKDEIVYPKGTSKEYTEKVNAAYEKALPILEKAGIKLEEFGGHSNDRGGYEDNTKEIMDKYVFRPFREKYPNGNNDAWNREYKELYEAIDAVLDKNYNDWWIKK